MSAQATSILLTGAIYVALIGFILYRQMTAQPVRARRLVVFPAVLAVFGLQQLTHGPLPGGFETVAFLVASLVIGVVAGVWRGTTFRVWQQNGEVVMKGTALTLIAWAVLIAVRVPFAFVGHAAKLPQGVLIGELLLALALTFAAQNAVVWLRATSWAGGIAVAQPRS